MTFQREYFLMGVHKPFLWPRSLIRAQVYLSSSYEEMIIKPLIVSPVRGIDETLEVQAKYLHPLKIAAMSKANPIYVKIRPWKGLLL